MQIENTKLRRDLENITTKRDMNHNKKIKYVQEQIMNLKRHTIRLYRNIHDLSPDELPYKNYDCTMYAFNFYKDSRVCEKDPKPDNKYTQFLIDKGYITTKNKEDDDYLIYFDNKSIATHIGLYKNGRIVSKWGPFDIWEHKVEEVPLSYGNEAEYFGKLTYPTIYEYYLEFIKTKS